MTTFGVTCRTATGDLMLMSLIMSALSWGSSIKANNHSMIKANKISSIYTKLGFCLSGLKKLLCLAFVTLFLAQPIQKWWITHYVELFWQPLLFLNFWKFISTTDDGLIVSFAIGWLTANALLTKRLSLVWSEKWSSPICPPGTMYSTAGGTGR